MDIKTAAITDLDSESKEALKGKETLILGEKDRKIKLVKGNEEIEFGENEFINISNSERKSVYKQDFGGTVIIEQEGYTSILPDTPTTITLEEPFTIDFRNLQATIIDTDNPGRLKVSNLTLNSFDVEVEGGTGWQRFNWRARGR